MTGAASNSAPSRRGLLAALLAALAAGTVAAAVGLATDVSVGDENYHVRKAAAFLAAGGRAAFDPLYGPAVPPGIPYYDGPAWHAGLALGWAAAGRGFVAAQVYQGAWVAAAVLAAWAAGRRLGGEAAAWWTLLVAATLPALLLFGVLLYVEAALLAALMAAAAAVDARRMLPAGLAFGLAFLVKPTVAYAFPALAVAAVLAAEAGWKPRLAALVKVGVGAALLIGPDLLWRLTHLGTVGVPYLLATGGGDAVPETIRAMLREPAPTVYYQPASVLDPVRLLQFLGFALPLGAAGAVVQGMRGDRVVRGLGVVLGVYVVCQAAALVSGVFVDIRYALPGFVPMLLLAGRGLAALGKGRGILAKAMVAGALVQTAAVGGVAVHLRTVPSETMAAMRALGELPVEQEPGFVLAPEERITTWSGRPILWAAVNPGAFLFVWDDAKQRRIVDHYGIEYVVVPEARIYDDRRAKHTGGYPQSFIDRLGTLEWLDPDPVLDRGGLRVYRVRPSSHSAGTLP